PQDESAENGQLTLLVTAVEIQSSRPRLNDTLTSCNKHGDRARVSQIHLPYSALIRALDKPHETILPQNYRRLDTIALGRFHKNRQVAPTLPDGGLETMTHHPLNANAAVHQLQLITQHLSDHGKNLVE